MYCDTSLIVPVLEYHYSAEKGFPTIYPKRKDGGGPDTGMVRALATYYMDRPLFSLASSSLPWNRFQRGFIEDRSKVCTYLGLYKKVLLSGCQWFGAPVDVEEMMAKQPIVQSQLSSHLVRDVTHRRSDTTGTDSS